VPDSDFAAVGAASRVKALSPPIMAAENPLQKTWCVWELSRTSDGKLTSKEVCEFSTVEEFWKAWSRVPMPSEMFYDGYTRPAPKDGNNIVEGLALYAKGIFSMH
jgi:hypothetical protein